MINLLLADDCSVVDSVICPPPTVEPIDLGDLLSTVAERLESDGVLMLSGRWARYVEPYIRTGSDQDTPTTAHAGDWTAKVVEGDTWIRWRHTDGHAIWTCEVDAIPPRGKDSPLIEDNPILTAANFHQWQEMTGVPWVGTPGMTGNALLIDGYRAMNPKAEVPRWNTSGIWLPQQGGDRWSYGHIETAYSPVQWHRDYSGPLHGYDQNRAYLSAYSVVELPAGPLTHAVPGENDPLPFDPKLGGIWRVELSPWRFNHLLPDPAGYAPVLPDGSRWVTTPTLTLLHQLTERGDYAGFTIREAYTAPARRVTRKWAALLNDITGAAREPLATAAKQVYKQTYGMWARPARVHRPDWHYTIIAQNRVNLWRKMDAGARAGWPTLRGPEDIPSHQLPVRVETDCVFYEEQGEWADSAPCGFKLDPSGIKLGHFKPYVPKGER